MSIPPETSDDVVLAPESEATGKSVVSAFYAVHSELGPGFVEKAYHAALADELLSRGVDVQVEPALPFHYRGRTLNIHFRPDLVLDERVIVELKAVENLLPLHEAQLLSYMKMAQVHLGYLVNFNAPRMKGSFHRYIWFPDTHYRPSSLVAPRGASWPLR